MSQAGDPPSAHVAATCCGGLGRVRCMWLGEEETAGELSYYETREGFLKDCLGTSRILGPRRFGQLEGGPVNGHSF